MLSLPPESSSQTGRRAWSGPEMPPSGPPARTVTLISTPSNGLLPGPNNDPSEPGGTIMLLPSSRIRSAAPSGCHFKFVPSCAAAVMLAANQTQQQSTFTKTRTITIPTEKSFPHPFAHCETNKSGPNYATNPFSSLCDMPTESPAATMASQVFSSTGIPVSRRSSRDSRSGSPGMRTGSDGFRGGDAVT